MAGNIWVLAEQWRGQISEITYELLALGREIAAGTGAELEAVLLGCGVRALAAELGAASRVIYAEDAALAHPVTGVYAEALAQLAAEQRPRCILAPLTNVSSGIGTIAAARLELPAINFCKDVRVVDGRLEARCLLYGGKVEAVTRPAGERAVFGIWPGSRAPASGRSEAVPRVVDRSVSLPAMAAVKFRRYIEPESGDIDISKLDVLVGVGRGIQNKENVALAEELAKALGGAVCGSRPVIDQGWLPLSRQVGKSGHAIKPKLYIAVGISGAPEHVEGIRGADLIIAINTDAKAPILSVAHYGIVGDAVEVLPLLSELISRR